MDILKKIDWSKLLHIDPQYIREHLHFVASSKEETKIPVRFYSLYPGRPNPHLDYNRLFDFLKSVVHFWVHSPTEIEEIELDGLDPISDALKKFGNVDPISDGRYGELLLFALIESVLGAPLVFHKLENNFPNVQAKGSDGFHIGKHNDDFPLFFGESKIMGVFTQCIDHAMDSVNGFHKQDRSLIKEEIMIARKGFARAFPNMEQSDFDELYQSLNLRTQAPKLETTKLVHPVLLVYNQKGVEDWVHAPEFPQKNFSDFIEGVKSKVDLVKKRIDKYKLDAEFEFFLLPIDNVNAFREKFYESIHGRAFERGKSAKS